MLELVIGPPFAGKDRFIAEQIERREESGEVGLVHLNFSSLYGSLIPGLQSTLRDQRVTDTGAARWTAYVLGLALSSAVDRELSGYIATDSARRAVAIAAQIGTSSAVEVAISEAEAHRRADQHIELVADLVDRADAKDAEARCRKMVREYYREAGELGALEVRRVPSPEVPSANAVRYAWEAALRQAKRGNTEKRDKWIAAAKTMLRRRGVQA